MVYQVLPRAIVAAGLAASVWGAGPPTMAAHVFLVLWHGPSRRMFGRMTCMELVCSLYQVGSSST